jgi:hypothetical protein
MNKNMLMNSYCGLEKGRSEQREERKINKIESE